MTLEMLLGVIALIVVPPLAGAGAAYTFDRWGRPDRKRRLARVTPVLDVALREWGAVIPAMVLLLAGVASVVAVTWVAGIGAHAIQGGVDWPVFRWFQAHQTKSWTDAWWKLTNVGSPVITQRLVVVGAVVLAVVWRKRIWWLPGAALALGYVFEKYGQIALKLVVHRGHPPTTFGTWPSGGCARVLVVYGLVAYFLARAHHNGRVRTTWVAGAAVVGLVLTVQAYARINNLEHWLTDVVGGIGYGVLLLALMVAGAETVQRGVAMRRSSTSEPAGDGVVEPLAAPGARTQD
jgi:hypothetical protein